MGYYVQTADPKERFYCGSLKDAYRNAAAILIGLYKKTNGNIHREITGYHGSTGICIFDSRSGKSCNHWVRFYNGSNPKDGYEEVWYDKRSGIGFRAKSFPKNWM